jgi:predicted ATPase
MLTRLKVSGFKNLMDVDVQFGPFTCIAGGNGVGKSNLFDAIRFLGALADGEPGEAAQSIRAEGRRTNETDGLFLRIGAESVDRMSFEAEMIVPRDFVDDLGRRRTAKSTLLRYSLSIGRRKRGGQSHLEVVHEKLVRLGKTAPPFPHEKPWMGSVLFGRAEQAILSLDEGLFFRRRTKRLPIEDISASRTLVSMENDLGNPTVLAARREMRSWRFLQLDPAALREVDDLGAPQSLGSNGSHLPATLFRLAQSDHPSSGNGSVMTTDQVYGQIAMRLSELIGGVRDIWVDVDERRQTLTVMVSDRTGTLHPARALSDGTLRFLALAVLELDPRAQGLICLEEPENGIHPGGIPAMLRLLQDIPTETALPVAPDNPLRQVIVNTHSPGVVAQVPDDSLLVAEPREMLYEGKRFQGVVFSSLPGTWRAQTGASAVARGNLIAYLNPVAPQDPDAPEHRVVDRADLQILLPN